MPTSRSKKAAGKHSIKLLPDIDLEKEKFRETRQMVDQFANSHPKFDEWGKTIEMALIAGFGLEEAYAVVNALDQMELKMPSKTLKQARTMRAAAHDKVFAKKMNIPQKVAREFVEADKAKIKPRKGK